MADLKPEIKNTKMWLKWKLKALKVLHHIPVGVG